MEIELFFGLEVSEHPQSSFESSWITIKFLLGSGIFLTSFGNLLFLFGISLVTPQSSLRTWFCLPVSPKFLSFNCSKREVVSLIDLESFLSFLFVFAKKLLLLKILFDRLMLGFWDKDWKSLEFLLFNESSLLLKWFKLSTFFEKVFELLFFTSWLIIFFSSLILSFPFFDFGLLKRELSFLGLQTLLLLFHVDVVGLFIFLSHFGLVKLFLSWSETILGLKLLLNPPRPLPRPLPLSTHSLPLLLEFLYE